MASAGNASERNGAGLNVLDLLTAQSKGNARGELVRKHDSLKAKMEALKKERIEQSKRGKR